MCFIQF
jgi:hypothetical protein